MNWILALMLVTTDGMNIPSAAAIGSMPLFQDEAACNNAGKDAVAAWLKLRNTAGVYSCSPAASRS